jgi:hypothetical protein
MNCARPIVLRREVSRRQGPWYQGGRTGRHLRFKWRLFTVYGLSANTATKSGWTLGRHCFANLCSHLTSSTIMAVWTMSAWGLALDKICKSPWVIKISDVDCRLQMIYSYTRLWVIHHITMTQNLRTTVNSSKTTFIFNSFPYVPKISTINAVLNPYFHSQGTKDVSHSPHLHPPPSSPLLPNPQSAVPYPHPPIFFRYLLSPSALNSTPRRVATAVSATMPLPSASRHRAASSGQ